MLIICAKMREMSTQITVTFNIVDEEFVAVGCESTVLTSAWRPYDPGSLHHGFAADFDSADMPEDIRDPKWKQIEDRVRYRLGNEYDVIAHGPRAHLHVEWDIRGKPSGGVAA